MPHLDYARPAAPRPVSDARAAAPGLVAAAVVALVLLGWGGFFLFGGQVAIDTHWTNRPQDYPEFQLTPWRPAPPGAGVPGGRMTREAVLPLRFRTLRFVQVTDDGGAWVETVGYYADVRWGPTGVALVVTAALPWVAYVGLRRLLR